MNRTSIEDAVAANTEVISMLGKANSQLNGVSDSNLARVKTTVSALQLMTANTKAINYSLA